MRSSKVRVVVGFVRGAGVLALCLVACFRVVSAAEVTLVTREVSLGKVHPGLNPESLTVSPDSKRVAYAAERGHKWLVVVDGVEGKEYDVFLKGSRLVFDTPSQLHILAFLGDEFLRVEVEIVMPAAEPSAGPDLTRNRYESGSAWAPSGAKWASNLGVNNTEPWTLETGFVPTPAT